MDNILSLFSDNFGTGALTVIVIGTIIIGLKDRYDIKNYVTFKVDKFKELYMLISEHEVAINDINEAHEKSVKDNCLQPEDKSEELQRLNNEFFDRAKKRRLDSLSDTLRVDVVQNEELRLSLLRFIDRVDKFESEVLIVKENDNSSMFDSDLKICWDAIDNEISISKNKLGVLSSQVVRKYDEDSEGVAIEEE